MFLNITCTKRRDKSLDIEKIAYALPESLLSPLKKACSSSSVAELRIRLLCPLTVLINNEKLFIKNNGELTDNDKDTVTITEEIIAEVFARLCEYSLYSKEDMISKGYIVMKNGCRAGVCGAFSEKDFNLRDVYSINIRIAKQIVNADLPIFYLMNKRLCSVLISGPPCSGKTTVLRELCRRYSNMKYNVCILDEKGEISGNSYFDGKFNLGLFSDVILYRSKADASSMALKYMNPDVIAFDELADDINVLKNCEKSGVKTFATIHSDSIGDAYKRLDKLGIDADCFDLIVQLDKRNFSISDSSFVRSVAV